MVRDCVVTGLPGAIVPPGISCGIFNEMLAFPCQQVTVQTAQDSGLCPVADTLTSLPPTLSSVGADPKGADSSEGALSYVAIELMGGTKRAAPQC